MTPPSAGALRRFLIARGWTARATSADFLRYAPPSDLAVPDYEVVLPVDDQRRGAERLVDTLIDSIASLYEMSAAGLTELLKSQATLLAIQLVAEETSDGSMPFPRFEGMVERLKALLLSTAGYVSKEDPILTVNPEEAKHYLSRCAFLQSGVGSYITNVRLPSGERLIPLQPSLTPARSDAHDDDKTFDDVNDTLQVLVDWSVRTVLQRPFGFEYSDLPMPDSDYLSVDAIEQLGGLFAVAKGSELNFTFSNVASTSRIPSGELNATRIGRLADYARRLRESMEDLEEIEVEGLIIELRSRDPMQNRNHVLIRTSIGGREALLAVRLPRRDYPIAAEAHVRRSPVRVGGLARKMKTQYKITRLMYFDTAR